MPEPANDEINTCTNDASVRKLLPEEIGLNVSSVIQTEVVRGNKEIKRNSKASDFATISGLALT